MTAKEAIKTLHELYRETNDHWYEEVYDMAISALEAQEVKNSNQEVKNSSDLISRQALCEYALNQKDKSVTPNDIMRFQSAQPLSEADLTELEGRFGKYVRYVVEDMISGNGERWKT